MITQNWSVSELGTPAAIELRNIMSLFRRAHAHFPDISFHCHEEMVLELLKCRQLLIEDLRVPPIGMFLERDSCRRYLILRRV